MNSNAQSTNINIPLSLNNNNPAIPITQLPAELIIRICRINAYRNYEPYICFDEGEPPADISKPLQDTLAASQVCSQWRTILLSAPELWRHFIDVYHPSKSWTDLLLKRSEPMSIDFMRSPHRPRGFHNLEDIRLHMQSGMHQRLAAYRVCLVHPRHDAEDYLSTWPQDSSSWPLLQHLCLCFEEIGDLDDETPLSDDAGPQKLPENFPGLATPALQRLHLGYCYMPDWQKLKTMGDTLTYLNVHCPSRTASPSIDGWIDILQGLPHLEGLSLTCAINESSDGSTLSSPSRFTLDVVSIRLLDSPSCCALFLDRISFSPRCRFFAFKAYNARFSLDDSLKSICSHLPQLYNQIVVPPTFAHTGLSLSEFYFSTYGLLGPADSCPSPFFAEDGTCASIPTNISGHFSVGFDHTLYAESGGPTWQRGERPARNAVLALFLNRIKHIRPFLEFARVFDFRYFSDSAQSFVLGALLRCQKLYKITDMSLALWKMLYSELTDNTEDADDVSGEHQNLLPALRVIGFDREVRLVKERRNGLSLLDDLVRFCKYRRDIGVPIQTIYLEEDTVRKGRLIRTDCLDEVKSRIEPLDVSLQLIDGEEATQDPSSDTERGDTDSEEEIDEGGSGMDPFMTHGPYGGYLPRITRYYD